MISEKEFFKQCEKGICLRNTFKSKNCEKEFRRKLCYNRYIQLLEKQEQKKIDTYIEKGKEIQDYLERKERGETIEYPKNEEWDSFRQKIIERDEECLVWRILESTEKIYIVRNFGSQLINIGKGIIDIAHVISRSEAPQLIYDMENVFACGRYFHSLLDSYKDLVTQMPVKREKREWWLNRIMVENNLWDQDKTFDQFRKEKLG